MRIVQATISRLGEGDHALAQRRIEGMNWGPSSIAMGQGRGALLSIRRENPPEVTH